MEDITARQGQTDQTDVLSLITMVFFVLTFVIKAFTDQLFVQGEVSSGVAYSKYVTAAVACIAAFIRLHDTGERRFIPEFNRLAILAALFTVESFILSAVHGSVETEVISDLLKFVMPIFMAYGVLNALSAHQIKLCMSIVFYVCVVGYIVNLVRSGVTFSQLAEMNFATSSSPTEDSGFYLIALVFCLYFLYFRDNIFTTVIAIAFCILTFKRLAILVCILATIISFFVPRLMRIRVNRRWRTICKLLTLAATVLWFWLLLPQQQDLFIRIFGQTPFEFTSGRSSSMNYLLESGFTSFGYGSANAVIFSMAGVPFEMDLLRIALELTPVVMVIFIWLFWDIAGDSFWGYLIIGFFMLNMITSDCLFDNFSFTLVYITIALVNESLKRDADQSSEFASAGSIVRIARRPRVQKQN